jgi:hypothetical protein
MLVMKCIRIFVGYTYTIVGLDALDDGFAVNPNSLKDYRSGQRLIYLVLDWQNAVEHIWWEVFRTRPLHCTTVAYFRDALEREIVFDDQWLDDRRVCAGR